MIRRGMFDWIQNQDGGVLAVLSIDYTYGMPIYKLSLATRLLGQ